MGDDRSRTPTGTPESPGAAREGSPASGVNVAAEPSMRGDNNRILEPLSSYPSRRGVLAIATATLTLSGLFGYAFQVGADGMSWPTAAAIVVVTVVGVLVAPLLVAVAAARSQRRERDVSRLRVARIGELDRRGQLTVIQQLRAEAARLTDEFTKGQDQSNAAAHPLLAMEFALVARRLRVLRERRKSLAWAVDAQAQIYTAQALHLRLRRRLRAARLMYAVNLPLTRQAATNFAATTAADRIDRLTGTFATYLTPTGGSDA
ncbi:hypothetical protein AB0J83_47430 [Actinoplanes sp. NPDC049596]|uniref:hypothetical protein n=1 Tax=unclassified Actinoplanes TaxID=2626549 RepID=UPI0034220816